MLAAVEHGPILCSDSNILCLSWKGRVPKSEKDKPVCRRRYYEEGWLATGNGRGVVGVTFTSSHCRRDRSTPQRINFNLRGHNSEVVLVRWNEPFQKLATCDMEGGIFVWIQYEGRWSVELVNDRGAQVSDFTWSHDGTQALIAYRDGFVLVGSVSGQRHWSSEINLESQITCGIWTPDDQQVLFGTADGQVIVMDCHGRMLAHVLLHESDGIVGMSWNCPDFLVEDSTESDTDSDDNFLPLGTLPLRLALWRLIKPLLTVTFLSGEISLMSNYDDLSPAVIRSGLKDVEAQWCSQGDLLAVAGMERHGLPSDAGVTRNALVKFYNVQGEHIYTLETPAQRPITTICWGHRDSRLFLACGPALYVVRVEHRVASLQLLCQQGIASALREEKDVGKLNMPSLLCSYVTTAFIPTIKPPIPDPNNIRDFVSYPTTGNERLHCTMKRAEDSPEAGGPCYTLYLEYLGGLVPILNGRRISKLRPEFVITDPKTDSKTEEVCVNPMISYADSCNCSDSSDVELSDEWVGKKSPKFSRGNRMNLEPRKSPKLSRGHQDGQRSPRMKSKLPQVPMCLCVSVIYKTSLLHLQPRQMTIYLPEVRKISHDFMSLPVFNPNVFSEDEDDLPGLSHNPPCTVNIPIAPIHSPAQAMSPTQSIGLVQSLLANQNIQLDVLTNPTTNAAAAQDPPVAAPYPVPARYPNPGQVIFNGLEMGPLLPGTLPPPPPPHHLPPQPRSQPQLQSRQQQHLPRTLPPSFSTRDGGPVEIQARKVNPPPPYPGTVAPSILAPDGCLKKDDFLLQPVTIQYPTPLGYERITTFDSSGNVEEVCRPRRRLMRNQNAYAAHGSATLKVTSSENKKVHLPYSSATLSRLSVPRYSIPSGDPPPYPDPANQVPATLAPPPQRLESSLIHATLRRDRRDMTLKVPAMMDSSRTLPTKAKMNSALGLTYQQRLPTALYTCTQCSSNSSSTSVRAHHSTIIVHSKSASQSSYSLLGSMDTSRDRTVYVNSAFTEDETLSQHRHLDKPVRQMTLGDVGLSAKRPPPYQWEASAAEEFCLAPEQTMLAPPPPPHKPPPLILGQAQHLDVTRLPFVLTTKPPSSPGTSTLTFPSGYQISLSPFPPGVGHSRPPMQTLQNPPPQCGPGEVVLPVPFAQQDSNLVLSTGYSTSLANLACCTLPPMYPGAGSCAGLQLHAVNLHPWNPYPCPPPMQDPPAPPLPTKTHQTLEKSILSPPPAALPPSKCATEDPTESATGFPEPSSLNESPVTQESDRFNKKSRKRPDSRAEEGNVSSASRKDGRTLSDFNSLIASPRLGNREKKKPKGPREQLNRAKKMSRAANEFQDSSESEPELFISGDELMNQNQSSKKSWKNKRSLRMASELEEIKCRKANEREDRSLGSQGFVYVMANKQPLWNEATQVYQLDFGGRVTQESAKNFQIELDGRQVMQFGRIDGNAYILDFQYPFSAVQAFAVALANVTQRLK
uniref:Tubby-related protein 4 n=1 Tax=Hippocampus comes TaxID=109280 RepID=A0A3Q2YWF7_HIPCM